MPATDTQLEVRLSLLEAMVDDLEQSIEHLAELTQAVATAVSYSSGNVNTPLRIYKERSVVMQQKKQQRGKPA